jgi:hypothetical protein
MNVISAPISDFPLHGMDAASGRMDARGGMGSAESSSQEGRKSDTAAFTVTGPTPSGTLDLHSVGATQNASEHLAVEDGTPNMEGQEHFFSDINTLSSSPRGDNMSLPPLSPDAPRTQQGVEFVTSMSMTPSIARRRLTTIRGPLFHHMPTPLYSSGLTEAVPTRLATMISYRSPKSVSGSPRDWSHSKHSDLGGFPGLATLAKNFAQRMLPRMYRKLEHKLTLPYSMTLNAQHTLQEPKLVRDPQTASWLKFNGLIVGRNSFFHTDSLTDEQLEKIGGVEYRALRLLSYLVPFVSV